MTKPILFTRRAVLFSGAAAAAFLRCGQYPVSVEQPPDWPTARWPGDEDMTQPMQLPALSDPLIFTASAIVNPNAGGSVNTAALANPHGMAMELLEVRFRVFAENTSNNNFLTLTGQAIGVKMDMGNIPIVDSAVPISQFGSFRDTSEFGSQQSASFNGALTTPVMYKWRLKYPLYVPAGAVVIPSFEHLGQNPFPVNVEVVYICRTVPEGQKIPSRLMVPWVSSYNSKSFDQLTSTAAKSDQSSELDLLNPFKVPLEITKLTGRAALISTGVEGLDLAIEEQMQFRSRLATVRMRSSRGDDVVRTPTPFNGLFPLGWRAWDIAGQWLMRPGEFYKVRIDVAAVDFTTAATGNLSAANPGRVQFSMGMIGYRSIATKTVSEAA